MKNSLSAIAIVSAIGFTLVGFSASPAHAQVIPLTFDQSQSTMVVSIDGVQSSSSLSGTATIDLENVEPPAGAAQITQLDLTAEDPLNFRFFLGLVSASGAPGELMVSMVTPGQPSTLANASFDQLDNVATIEGDIVLSDPANLAGGNQTIDLSTLEISPFDVEGINVMQSGDIITVTNTFSIIETLDLGQIEVDVTFVATGVVPIEEVLLGDVNLDGVVTFLDIAPFIAILADFGFQEEADIDRNGAVAFLDIAPFIAILSGQSL